MKVIYTRRLVSVSLQRVVSFHDEHLVSSIAYKLSTAVNPISQMRKLSQTEAVCPVPHAQLMAELGPHTS